MMSDFSSTVTLNEMSSLTLDTSQSEICRGTFDNRGGASVRIPDNKRGHNVGEVKTFTV